MSCLFDLQLESSMQSRLRVLGRGGHFAKRGQYINRGNRFGGATNARRMARNPLAERFEQLAFDHGDPLVGGGYLLFIFF